MGECVEVSVAEFGVLEFWSFGVLEFWSYVVWSYVVM